VHVSILVVNHEACMNTCRFVSGIRSMNLFGSFKYDSGIQDVKLAVPDRQRLSDLRLSSII